MNVFSMKCVFMIKFVLYQNSLSLGTFSVLRKWKIGNESEESNFKMGIQFAVPSLCVQHFHQMFSQKCKYVRL